MLRVNLFSISVKATTSQELVAQITPNEYSISTFDIENTKAFLGQTDYIITIRTNDNHQFGQMITLEVGRFFLSL